MSSAPETAKDEVIPLWEWLKENTDCTRLSVSMCDDAIILCVKLGERFVEIRFNRLRLVPYTVAQLCEIVKKIVQRVLQDDIIGTL